MGTIILFKVVEKAKLADGWIFIFDFRDGLCPTGLIIICLYTFIYKVNFCNFQNYCYFCGEFRKIKEKGTEGPLFYC